MGTLAGTGKITTVYLMRHGQTAYNVEDRLRGRADLPLTTKGQAQAKALGQLFADVALGRVLASPLQRAIKTAAPVAHATGLFVEPVDGFIDRDYGAWTGEERVEVKRLFGSIEAAPGVEAWDKLRRRVLEAFNSVLATSCGPAIAIVAHDATNRALIATLVDSLFGKPGEIPQHNGCWSRLEFVEGRWTLPVLNAVPGDGRCP